MATAKTAKNQACPLAFVNSIEHEVRSADAKILLALFSKITQQQPNFGEALSLVMVNLIMSTPVVVKVTG